MPEEALQEFVDIFDYAFEEMHKDWVEVMEFIQEYRERLENLKRDRSVDFETLEEDIEVYNASNVMGEKQLESITMFFNAILIGDYIYSLYFSKSVREHFEKYNGVTEESTPYGEIMEDIEKKVHEWYTKWDADIKFRQSVAATPAGEKFFFAPLLLCLVAHYYKGDRDELIKHFTDKRDEEIASHDKTYFGADGKEGCLKRAAESIEKGKEVMYGEVVNTLKEIEESENPRNSSYDKRSVLKQLEELKTAFREWHTKLEEEESDERGRKLLDCAIGLRIRYKVTNMLSFHIIIQLISELCSFGKFDELLPIDRK